MYKKEGMKLKRLHRPACETFVYLYLFLTHYLLFLDRPFEHRSIDSIVTLFAKEIYLVLLEENYCRSVLKKRKKKKRKKREKKTKTGRRCCVIIVLMFILSIIYAVVAATRFTNEHFTFYSVHHT